MRVTGIFLSFFEILLGTVRLRYAGTPGRRDGVGCHGGWRQRGRRHLPRAH